MTRTTKNYKKDNGNTLVIGGKLELNGEVTKNGENVDLGSGENSSVSWDEIEDKPTTFAPSTHNHNNLYYSKTEVDDLISGLQSQIEGLGGGDA